MYKKLALVGLTVMIGGSMSVPMSASWDWKKSAHVGMWVAVAAVGTYAVSLLIKQYWQKTNVVQKPDTTQQSTTDNITEKAAEALVQEIQIKVAQENLNKEIVKKLCKYSKNLQTLLTQNNLKDGWKHKFKEKVCAEFNKTTAELIEILQNAHVEYNQKKHLDFIIEVLK